MLYRPGTADAGDPSFADALRLCDADPELKQWFDEHCAVYAALRARFRVAVPEGLKEQIVAERPVPAIPLWRRPAMIGALALAMLAVLVALLWAPRQPRELAGLPAFRNHEVSYALRLYRMDLASTNLDEIRAFCREKNSIANYVLPASLTQRAQATGCVASSWHGNPVTMICFKSGEPLTHGEENDLWFFVIDHAAVADTPADRTPAIARVNRTTTASWTEEGKTYVLVASGDEAFLRRFL